MVFDLETLKRFYASYESRIAIVRKYMDRPLSLAEKILFSHLYDIAEARPYKRGVEYANFQPDRVAMQDATAQMALLQFMNAGRKKVFVPTTVHCDHLIKAYRGSEKDLAVANDVNKEVYDFLKTASANYGIGFWKPGAGIIHQIVLENYAFPGGMIIGTDSHTPNAGGLGMFAVGVGGADAVDVMSGNEWELKIPELIGVKLTGKLNGWASPKDVILKLAGILTVKGGTNSIIEYFGEGAQSISCTGKATICNMGAEVGATTSVFPYDSKMSDYLRATEREIVADMADNVSKDLRADEAVFENPENFYDKIVEIDLSSLEPYVNGPFTPDAACPISEFAARVKNENYPSSLEVALIGSCTNSSYQDLSRAASIARQVAEKKLVPKAKLIVNPGSERIYDTAKRDAIIDNFKEVDATIMANACGPCIGQWQRITDYPMESNSIVTSFNRNFAKRADGNPNTNAFITSPEVAVALSIAGSLLFNPLIDTLVNNEGDEVKLDPPFGDELPSKGFINNADGFIAPCETSIPIKISENSERLQRLLPFSPLNAADFSEMVLLIKVKGKCTTDHISQAGVWLKYRGHLENISDNLLMGAQNAFTDRINETHNALNNSYARISEVAKEYKKVNHSSIIVAEENYGEGSSREHAAMEPRFLNVKVVLAKSFARIHETNLKKQAVLALTFADKEDYKKIEEDDIISVKDVESITPGESLTIVLNHKNGATETIVANHTYNKQQIAWLKAGSALNAMCNGKN